MINLSRSLLAVAFLYVLLVTPYAAVGKERGLRYPIIKPTELNIEIVNCVQLDRRIRQVDAIRWSMREDGIELETNLEQMVQLSLATAAAIAIAVPMMAVGAPDPQLVALPYAATFTGADKLKLTDALLIALLSQREELICPPHPECVIQSDRGDTLTNIRSMRERVESKEMREFEGLQELTMLLDNLCPVGDISLERLHNQASR
jgi:hypothetical protein